MLLLSPACVWHVLGMVIFLQLFITRRKSLFRTFTVFVLKSTHALATYESIENIVEINFSILEVYRRQMLFQYYSLNLASCALLSTQIPVKQGNDDFAIVAGDDGKIDCYLYLGYHHVAGTLLGMFTFNAYEIGLLTPILHN